MSVDVQITQAGGQVRVEQDGSVTISPGGAGLNFYSQAGAGPWTTQQLLATGAGRTVDDVITALQNLGLLRQS